MEPMKCDKCGGMMKDDGEMMVCENCGNTREKSSEM